MRIVRKPGIVPLTCVVAAAIFGLSACTRDDPAKTDYGVILHFDTARVRLATRTDTLHLLVEVAATGEQRTLGLMERRTLPDSGGMLFVFSETQPATDAFWMYRTRVPLDIAFIDSAGTIRTIHRMEPCVTVLPEGCPTYPADAPFRATLEVNAGYFGRHGIQPGDRVSLGDTAARAGLSRPSGVSDRSGSPDRLRANPTR